MTKMLYAWRKREPTSLLPQLLVAGALLVMILTAYEASAEHRHEPLNGAEVEQLRDAAQEPEERILLYVKFIKSRAGSLEQLYSDPRFEPGRASQIRDLLEDIDQLVQEMDDNIDGYATQRTDLRKPLKAVVEMEGGLAPKLQAMKQNTDLPQAQTYSFALRSVMESVNDSLGNARQLLQEHETAFKNTKKK